MFSFTGGINRKIKTPETGVSEVYNGSSGVRKMKVKSSKCGKYGKYDKYGKSWKLRRDAQ